MIKNNFNLYKSIRMSLLFLLLFMFGSQRIYGQLLSDKHLVNFSIPEISILDFEPNNLPIQFEFKPSVEAGGALQITSPEQTKWLNYTCGLNRESSPRNIYMQVANGELPEGVTLELTVGNAVGGRGMLGTPVGSVLLTEHAQLIITGIGGSYTGNGVNFGYPINYKVAISDYSKLIESSASNIQIMVTITD